MIDQAVSRSQAHAAAKKLLVRGEYANALQGFYEAEKRFGENIALKADIATCHYFQGAILEWQHYVGLTEATLKSQREKLSAGSLASASLMLGKFREEEGRLVEAMGIYQDCLKHLALPMNAEFAYLCMAQILRLRATFTANAQVGEYFRVLTQLRKIEENYLDRIDIQHALMLSDLHEIGLEAAERRLLSIFAYPGLTPGEKALVYYDFLEACLRRDLCIPPRVAQLEVMPNDTYEAAIGKLVFLRSEANASLIDAPMSPANQLRLLSLLIKFQLIKEEEGTKRIRLLLEPLSAGSRKLWRQYLAIPNRAENLLEIFCEMPKVHCNGRTRELGRKRLLFQIMEAFRENRELGTTRLTRVLWQSEYNESYYHRLRMILLRLNTFFEKEFGLDGIFTITKEYVRLRPGVKLR